MHKRDPALLRPSWGRGKLRRGRERRDDSSSSFETWYIGTAGKQTANRKPALTSERQGRSRTGGADLQLRQGKEYNTPVPDRGAASWPT